MRQVAGLGGPAESTVQQSEVKTDMVCQVEHLNRARGPSLRFVLKLKNFPIRFGKGRIFGSQFPSINLVP